ncbi:endolytic transglycosylase MltG [Desulfosporosinus sp. PR]|uniref:endolytic transglycosylase MltG n=1 Tax=Candidatus Desulfosporosinus nitrosoreducens TaxID=3401928 RepID=UPI0027EC49CB|nr:endolytic transglycosylase MltG [Desulfosporosinus sp. PR]MDQ7095542.1 endolytic transglycosylase MltG [Desulfosporosinus sp. PR]
MSAKKKSGGWHAGIIFLALIGTLGLLLWWSWASEPYSAAGNSVKVTITSGTTTDQLADELEQRHVIRSAWLFRWLIRSRHGNFKMYAGDYELAPTMTPDEIIERLMSGAEFSDSIRVTIPEGFSTEQIIALLVQKGLGTKEAFTKVVVEDTFSYSFLAGAPKGIHRLEGFLFPDTYFIDAKASPHAVIDMFLQQFAKKLTPEVQTQLVGRKLTVLQWVTLASLIEKEAVKESDRPLIASVLINRLKINMPLQVDATIQFLLGTPKPKLYNKDLQIPSPYNTYLNRGLPPGPIANPGDASLQAALNPANTDFLYYVAKKDGYHAFAKTYQEHLKNIKLYQ